jgi:hypothetical protein
LIVLIIAKEGPQHPEVINEQVHSARMLNESLSLPLIFALPASKALSLNPHEAPINYRAYIRPALTTELHPSALYCLNLAAICAGRYDRTALEP